MTDRAHSPVPPDPEAPQGSVLWTCASTDCEWTATSLLPEATRMSSYAQHLVAAVAITAPPTPAPAASSVVDAALLARAETLQAELDATQAELEQVRGMMRPMAAYLASGFAASSSSQEQPAAATQDTAKDSTKDASAATSGATAGAPSVSDMLDAVDGVVRTAADVVETAWPVLSKLLRGAAR